MKIPPTISPVHVTSDEGGSVGSKVGAMVGAAVGCIVGTILEISMIQGLIKRVY
jgi:hypothetical protein